MVSVVLEDIVLGGPKRLVQQFLAFLITSLVQKCYGLEGDNVRVLVPLVPLEGTLRGLYFVEFRNVLIELIVTGVSISLNQSFSVLVKFVETRFGVARRFDP